MSNIVLANLEFNMVEKIADSIYVLMTGDCNKSKKMKMEQTITSSIKILRDKYKDDNDMLFSLNAIELIVADILKGKSSNLMNSNLCSRMMILIKGSSNRLLGYLHNKEDIMLINLKADTLMQRYHYLENSIWQTESPQA